MKNFTPIPNWLIDEVMPACSNRPNTWRIVCAVARKTVGWQKERDKISITQFMQMTGIGGRSSTVDAISDAIENGFIERFEVGYTYEYRLSNQYQNRTSDNTTSPETGLVPVIKQDQLGGKTSHETGHTKESIKENKDSLDFDNIVLALQERTGLLINQSDIDGLLELEKLEIVISDIDDALKWRSEKKLPPVKRASGLFAGIKTSRLMRIQKNDGNDNGKVRIDITKGLQG